MNYNDSIDEYIEFYRSIYEKIEGACNCIDSNPSTSLYECIDMLHQEIIGNLSNLVWDDEVSSQFNASLEFFKANFELISTSIVENFKVSEEKYKEIQSKLKILNDNIKNMSDICNIKPKKSDFTKLISYNDGGGNKTRTEFNENAYDNAYTDWKDKCDGFSNTCSSTIESINNILKDLENINSMSFEITTIPQIKFAAPVNLNFSALTPYICNKISYHIISSDDNIKTILKKVGGQKPDKCYQCANNYAKELISSSSNGTSTISKTGLSCENQGEVLKIAASELAKGNPTVVQVYGKTTKSGQRTRHFVTLIGIKQDADISNLQESDFLYLDPAGAEVKQLNTDSGKLINRYLISAQDVTFSQDKNNKYLIEIFSDQDQYLSETCCKAII